MAFKMPQPALYSDFGLVPSLWRILRILEFMAILAFFGSLVSLGETLVHGLLWPNCGFASFLALLAFFGLWGLTVRGPWGLLEAPRAQICWGPKGVMGPKMAPKKEISPYVAWTHWWGPGPPRTWPPQTCRGGPPC